MSRDPESPAALASPPGRRFGIARWINGWDARALSRSRHSARGMSAGSEPPRQGAAGAPHRSTRPQPNALRLVASLPVDRNRARILADALERLLERRGSIHRHAVASRLVRDLRCAGRLRARVSWIDPTLRGKRSPKMSRGRSSSNDGRDRYALPVCRASGAIRALRTESARVNACKTAASFRPRSVWSSVTMTIARRASRRASCST